MSKDVITGYIQFRDKNWDWIGDVVSIGEVGENTIVDVVKYVPNGYLISNETFNPIYKVTSGDVQWVLDNPNDSVEYGLPAGCMVLNIGINLSNIITGISIDIARHYYSVEVIKAFIDELSHAKNGYVKLHMMDHESVAVECDVFDQKVENSIFENNRFINPRTGLPFLSKTELKDIVEYGKVKNVIVVPEVEVPGHMGAILIFLKDHAKDIYQKIKQDDSDLYVSKTMDYSKSEAITFAKQLVSEYFDIFSRQGNSFFSIGGDEIGQISKDADIHPINNPDLIKFVNEMNNFIKLNGFKMWMYNDYIATSDINNLDKDISIMYWSPSGGLSLNDTNEYVTSGTKNNVSAQILLDLGFKVQNYNGYYLYMNANENTFEENNMNYTINDMNNNFKLVNFRLNSEDFTNLSENILGASISIWSAEAKNYTDLEIQEYTKDLVGNFVRLVNP